MIEPAHRVKVTGEFDLFRLPFGSGRLDFLARLQPWQLALLAFALYYLLPFASCSRWNSRNIDPAWSGFHSRVADAVFIVSGGTLGGF
jgi:hypothetical protein